MADEEDQRDHENLEALLNWLNPDRDEAWAKYEQIRKRLVKIFTWRQCADVESLADEVLERVERRIVEVVEKFSAGDDPAKYFYGVAKNVALESFRNRERFPEFEENHGGVFKPPELEGSANSLRDDLDYCLEQLNEEDRYIALAYYQYDQQTKKAERNRLARELGISKGALWTRVFRIRSLLEKCLKGRSEHSGEPRRSIRSRAGSS